MQNENPLTPETGFPHHASATTKLSSTAPSSVADIAAILAAAARSAAAAEQRVLELSAQLARAKEIAKAEQAEEVALLYQRIAELGAELKALRNARMKSAFGSFKAFINRSLIRPLTRSKRKIFGSKHVPSKPTMAPVQARSRSSRP